MAITARPHVSHGPRIAAGLLTAAVVAVSLALPRVMHVTRSRGSRRVPVLSHRTPARNLPTVQPPEGAIPGLSAVLKHHSSVIRVLFAPGGGRLVSLTTSGQIAVWRLHPLHLETCWNAPGAQDLAFSPDGRWLVAAGKTVDLWDTRTWHFVRHLRYTGACGPYDPRDLSLSSIAFSSGGRYLVAGAHIGGLAPEIWDTQTWHGAAIGILVDEAETVAALPGSAELAFVDGFDVTFYDPARRRIIRRLGNRLSLGPSHRLTVSPDRRWMLIRTDKGTEYPDQNLVLLDVRAGRAIREFDRIDLAACARFSPDNRIVATGGDDNAVHLWRSGTWRPLARLCAHDNAVEDLAFSADGSTLASADDDGKVMLWNVSQALRNQPPHKDRAGRERVLGSFFKMQVSAIAPDGSSFCSHDIADDMVWSLRTGRLLCRLKDREAGAVAYSTDSRWLFVPSANGIAVYDTRTWRRREFLTSDDIEGHAFLPGGRILAGTGEHGMLQFWNLQSLCSSLPRRPRLTDIAFAQHVPPPRSCSPFGPGPYRSIEVAAGVVALVDSDGVVSFWRGPPFHRIGVLPVKLPPAGPDEGGIVVPSNAPQTRSIQIPAPDDDTLDTLVLSRDGALVALDRSDDPDGKGADVTIYRTKGGVRVSGLQGADGDTIQFSSDGSELLSASGGDLGIWDVRSGRQRLTLKGFAGAVNDWLTWPGGQFLITGCDSGRVQLWDRHTGRLLRTYIALHVPVFALARFGSRLVAVGANYDDLRYWSCEPGRG